MPYEGDINNSKARKKKKHLLCIGSNIKVQRINSGLAQTELAYILDVSVEAIENIEEGNGALWIVIDTND